MYTFDLFKYYAPTYKSEANLSFYTNGSIYFQQPIKFNDPWDCKAPPIKIPRQLNVLKDIWMKLASKSIPSEAANLWDKMKTLPRTEIKQIYTKHFTETFEQQREKLGVFCLSFIPDSELSWSHYAASHTGYMLHFHLDLARYEYDSSIKELGVPIPVIYKNKRVVWRLDDYLNIDKNHVYDLIRFKSNAWEYEYELRLLNIEKSGFIKMPLNFLKSIVVGIDADSELRHKLNDIGDILNVPVYSAKMNSNKYKIDIPGLEIDGIHGKAQYENIVDSGHFELKKSE